MSSQAPDEMLAISVPSYASPARYQLSTLPQSVVSKPSDVVVRIHAASINPIDVKKAAGLMKRIVPDKFPYKIGYDCSGVVADVGANVSQFKVGDEVYALLPEASRGTWSEYVKCSEAHLAPKPSSLSFGDAASLPLAAMTALQALAKYKHSLSGKTVFVPAGLSGTGSCACQLAKNVFNAGKVITTVSTTKVARVPELLGEGVVDQVIDYTKSDPMAVIPARSVDFILDTTGQAMQFLSLLVPATGLIVSISTQPSGRQLQESVFMAEPHTPRLAWYIRLFLDLMDALRRARAKRWRVGYEYMFVEKDGTGLRALTEHVMAGKLKPVVGLRVDLRDIEDVKNACRLVYEGKGGLGKAVIQVIPD